MTYNVLKVCRNMLHVRNSLLKYQREYKLFKVNFTDKTATCGEVTVYFISANSEIYKIRGMEFVEIHHVDRLSYDKYCEVIMRIGK